MQPEVHLQPFVGLMGSVLFIVTGRGVNFIAAPFEWVTLDRTSVV